MADQHHETNPALTNNIADDIPNILECQKYHWDILQMLIGVHATTLASISPPGPQRSQFLWKDGDEIYIEPGVYFHDGTTRQSVFWDAQITFQLQSGGSNAASDDYGADGWHYIYIDDSAVVTQASPELDADCFLNDMTAPTWSDAKHGWYNGSDRCIFAVYETGGAILEFFHDGGDLVVFADLRSEFGLADIPDAFTDVDIATSVPGFSTKARASFYMDAAGDTNGSLWRWRVNGQTGTSGHTVGYTLSGESEHNVTVADVFTDSSQIFEHKSVTAGSHEGLISVSGWYFPTGM